MRFAKGHGTGNDFVVLPDPDGRLDLTAELVTALCDRRRGIGADGVLRVVRAAACADAPAGPEWFMDYRNADGSLAEMCGNGARVFVRYLLEAGLAAPGDAGPPGPGDAGPPGPGDAGLVQFGTRAGVEVAVVGAEISISMRRPRVYGQSSALLGPLQVAGAAVDVGNPHLVCRVPDVSLVDLRTAPVFDPALFPSGVNVEVVSGNAAGATMRVYERGSGETMSCGTGACAVAAVLLDGGTGAVPVDVPGGRLTVTVAQDRCWLAGPAVIVASGEVDPDALSPDALSRAG